MPVLINDKFARLGDIVDETDGRPTAQVVEVYDMLVQQLAGLLASLETVLSQLAPVNDFLRSAGQPAIVPTPDELLLAP
jgi:hypothetical protein